MERGERKSFDSDVSPLIEVVDNLFDSCSFGEEGDLDLVGVEGEPFCSFSSLFVLVVVWGDSPPSSSRSASSLSCSLWKVRLHP